MNKKKEAHYVHVYILRDKIESCCSLKEKMNVLGLKNSDIF